MVRTRPSFFQQNNFSIPTETTICQRLRLTFARCFFYALFMHVQTCTRQSKLLYLFQIAYRVSYWVIYRVIYRVIIFQSILKTDSKLSAFFHLFRSFLFPSKSIVFLTLVLSSGLSLFIIAS